MRIVFTVEHLYPGKTLDVTVEDVSWAISMQLAKFLFLFCYVCFYCRQQKTSGNSSDSEFLDDPPRSNKIIYVPSDSETDSVSFKR